MERNRIKRVLRDAFRRHRNELPASMDLVINAYSSVLEMPFAQLEQELLEPNVVAHIRQRRLTWAQLLKRTFSVDVLACPNCSGRLRVIAAIDDPSVVRKILAHLGLPTERPTIAPARSPPEQFDFDDFDQVHDTDETFAQ